MAYGVSNDNMTPKSQTRDPNNMLGAQLEMVFSNNHSLITTR